MNDYKFTVVDHTAKPRFSTSDPFALFTLWKLHTCIGDSLLRNGEVVLEFEANHTWMKQDDWLKKYLPFEDHNLL